MSGVCKVCGAAFAVYRGPKKRAAAGDYCNRVCMNSTYGGKGNPNWRGRRVEGHGYIKEYSPDHPHADREGYVYEHRRVMERTMGRVLLTYEVVHHINRQRDDNRPENLMLFQSQAEHLNWHRKEGDVK